MNDLLRKIQWLMFFRIVVVTLLLGATAIIQIKESQYFQDASPFYFYLLIGITYFLTLVYALLLRRIKRLEAFAYLQILGDIFLVTFLIYLTGGVESIFSWVYLLAIFSAGTILFRRGGLLMASASSICYGALLDLEFYGMIYPLGSRFALLGYKNTYVLYLIAMNMVSFYLVALLSAYLSEQVRRKEEELKERLVDYKQLEQLYKHIVQNVTSGLMTVDGAGRITSFNRIAEEITGYRLEEVYQEAIESIFPGIFDWFREITRRRGGEKIPLPRWETKFSRRDAALLTLGFTVSPLRDSRSNEIGSIFIFQDLTELREMEDELKRADRLAAIGTLAAGMAHEIRNPLASMSGAIEILKEELSGSSEQQQLMDIVLREANRLNALVTDFLLFAKPTLHGKENIRIGELIEEVLKMFTNSPDFHPGIRLVTHCEDELEVQGDPQHFKQIFWNLFINAAQAMPQGGELLVQTRRRYPVPSPDPESALGEICIGDTGGGIEEKNLDKIFDPFFTTKEKGTGLGLSIVHSILESYKGKVTVRSERGKGTTFTLFLPLK